ISSLGLIELSPLTDGLLPRRECLADPEVFGRQTPLTTASEEMTEFAHTQLVRGKTTRDKTLNLALAIHDYVAYQSGSTTVSDSAQAAFSARKGVCQDHAHIMLACLRSCGYFARYVSGYRYSDKHPEFASHAWVDVFDKQLEQWISVDATHRGLVEAEHCRIAVALDYTGAAPVRGVRRGGTGETMKVTVNLERVD
ncbi:MAG: transglutaminase family protein, partial [Limnobacter sp.]|nr:transglutaminase family protein [Limnobacter sp.]